MSEWVRESESKREWESKSASERGVSIDYNNSFLLVSEWEGEITQIQM